MPDIIIKGLEQLFKMPLSINGQTSIDIDIALHQEYSKNLVPILKSATKAELNPWTAIALATKKKASLLIKQLSSKKDFTQEQLQVIRFQRALLGKKSYVSTNNSSLMTDPLFNFLKKPAKKSKKIPTSLDDALLLESLTTEDLHHYWIPYSAVLKDFKEEGNTIIPHVDILEILTAVITEEPHEFQKIFIENKALKIYLSALSSDEILSLFSHKKLTDTHFKAIFTHFTALPNGKNLSRRNLINICATQPSALKYFDEKDNENLIISEVSIKTFTPNEIVGILTKKKPEGEVESYYYSVNEFYDALSLIQAKNNEFIKQINGKSLAAFLCRLQFSPEKEAKNNEIFNDVRENLENLNTEELCHLLKNADALIINQIQTRDHLNLARTQDDAQVAYYLSLIAKLARNPSKNLVRIREIVSMAIFNYDQIIEILKIVENIPSQHEQLSSTLVQKLLENKDSSIIKEIFCENRKFSVTFLKKKNDPQNLIFKLNIEDFAEVIADLSETKEILNLLETGFLAKTNDLVGGKQNNGLPPTTDVKEQISSALLIILKANNNANNAEIFKFIYFNRKFNFLPYINEKHLVKSFSHQLDKEDNDLKNKLTEEVRGIPIPNNLRSEDIPGIFLKAEKNRYSLPPCISNHLIYRIGNNGTHLSSFFNRPALQTKENYFSIIFYLYRHKHDHKIINNANYEFLYNEAIKYLTDGSNKLPEFIVTQGHHNDFLNLFKDPSISELLNSQTIIQTFLIAQGKNIHLNESLKNYLMTKLLNDPKLIQYLNDFFDGQPSIIIADIVSELFTTTLSIRRPISEKLLQEISNSAKIENFLGNININCSSKAFAEFLLTAFLFSNRNSNSPNPLRIYLTKNPNEIANIFLHGEIESSSGLNANHLLDFIQNQEILNTLQKTENRQYLHLTILNIAQSLLNIENKVRLVDTLIPTLSQQDILDIFIQANINHPEINLSPEICSLLVKELNFQQLPRLIRTLEEKKTYNTETLKKTLENIYRTQFDHQIQNEKKFSLPALILSVLYAIPYYLSLIGLVLHFLLPATKPSRLYSWLKHVFQPTQIEVEFTEKFNKKVWLSKIADKKLSDEKENIILEDITPTNTSSISNVSSTTILPQNIPSTQTRNSLINVVTGEIEPFPDKTNTYTYLFPSTKKRLDYKTAAVKAQIKAVKSSGALFRPDKNSYLIENEEKELSLPENQKKQMEESIAASEQESKQVYQLN